MKEKAGKIVFFYFLSYLFSPSIFLFMATEHMPLKEQKFRTSIDIPEKTRHEIISILNSDLAGSSDLYSQTKQAHWNVKGENFFQLHELFDDLADEVEDAIDKIAERVTALGGYAMGTVRMAAETSYIPEYDCHSSKGTDHVKMLAERYAVYAKRVREMIDTTAELGDISTSDLYTEISRMTDKALWFLEAHFQ